MTKSEPGVKSPASSLHRPVVQNIVQCLTQIFVDGFYADKVIERAFKNNRSWGSRDRKQVAETVYGCVRWWRKLRYAVDKEPSLNPSDFWLVVGAYLLQDPARILPDWVEFSALQAERVRERLSDQSVPRTIRESVPDWMDKVGAVQLGEAKWTQILALLNETAPVCLRANTLKAGRDEVRKKLANEDILSETIAGLSDAILLPGRKNIFASKVFHDGLFEVQDASSQKIVPLMEIQPGQRVVDACAGAGGKALHIAAHLQNRGKLLAMDVSEKKLGELKNRAKRAGADCIETRVIESSKTIKRLEESADRLLLDVPCTGLGVLRRNPDAKWKLSESKLAELSLLQKDILERYSKMLKRGGILVYATCSILPQENSGIVSAFLTGHPGEWEQLSEHNIWPGTDHGDGFYACVLKRL